MEVKAISYSYWRSIKRGTKDFQEDIVNNPKSSVSKLADEIRYIAQQEVVNGVITIEEYEQYLSEPYVA